MFENPENEKKPKVSNPEQIHKNLVEIDDEELDKAKKAADELELEDTEAANDGDPRNNFGDKVA